MPFNGYIVIENWEMYYIVILDLGLSRYASKFNDNSLVFRVPWL